MCLGSKASLGKNVRVSLSAGLRDSMPCVEPGPAECHTDAFTLFSFGLAPGVFLHALDHLYQCLPSSLWLVPCTL